MKEIAAKCDGYSGAALAGVARAAASHALERAVDEFSQTLNGQSSNAPSIMDCLVTSDDFDEAIEDVLQSMGNSDFSDEEEKENEEDDDEADDDEDLSP
jgi:SpoVK/Ycf46/Vps4 family AAA+-type ATPase